MRTFLVLICSLALACAAGGAQDKNKSKKQAPKKNQAQSTQHAAAPSSGPQKTKGSQHGTKIGGTPVSGAGEAWLVPVYVFELSGAGTVPVLAVADGLLATPPAIPPGVKILPAPAPALPEGTGPQTAPNR